MQGVTGQFIRTLAAANGIMLPEERVELVRRQYERLMESVTLIDTLQIPTEAEPALGPPFAPPSTGAIDRRR